MTDVSQPVRWEAARKDPRTGEWSAWIGVTADTEAEFARSGSTERWRFRTLYTGPSTSALQRALEQIAADQSATDATAAADRFQAIAREALAAIGIEESTNG